MPDDGQKPRQNNKSAAADNAFRQEARTFLAENYPQALRDKQERGETLSKEDHLSWHRILAKKGWSTPSWPQELGGTDWTPTQKYIWSEEQARADTIGTERRPRFRSLFDCEIRNCTRGSHVSQLLVRNDRLEAVSRDELEGALSWNRQRRK